MRVLCVGGGQGGQVQLSHVRDLRQQWPLLTLSALTRSFLTDVQVERALRDLRAEVEATYVERDQSYCWDLRDEYLEHFLHKDFVTGEAAGRGGRGEAQSCWDGRANHAETDELIGLICNGSGGMEGRVIPALLLLRGRRGGEGCLLQPCIECSGEGIPWRSGFLFLGIACHRPPSLPHMMNPFPQARSMRRDCAKLSCPL